MSLNTAHANGGVLIHAGERILLFCDNVTMEFHGQRQSEFVGTKRGRLYLTTHRMIFNAKDAKEKMQSFSFPFVTLSAVELDQPMFGANYIKGECRAQPNGNWMGTCKFELHFKSGGAIEFGQAMLRAASEAQRNAPGFDAPPPYQPPTTDWYAAPPPAYETVSSGSYGWTLPTNTFPHQPPANSVYMTDMPPPYPGINMPYSGVNAQYPGTNAPYPGTNAPYPGMNAPYPGMNAPYPGMNAPYPGANAPYPGANAPYPGANAPYPGANAPYPNYASGGGYPH